MEKINIRKERLSLIEYLNVLVKIQALYDVISDAAFERFKVRRQQTAKSVKMDKRRNDLLPNIIKNVNNQMNEIRGDLFERKPNCTWTSDN